MYTHCIHPLTDKPPFASLSQFLFNILLFVAKIHHHFKNHQQNILWCLKKQKKMSISNMGMSMSNPPPWVCAAAFSKLGCVTIIRCLSNKGLGCDSIDFDAELILTLKERLCVLSSNIRGKATLGYNEIWKINIKLFKTKTYLCELVNTDPRAWMRIREELLRKVTVKICKFVPRIQCLKSGKTVNTLLSLFVCWCQWRGGGTMAGPPGSVWL